MELVFGCGLAVALVVRLFGHCRQAFYQSKADIEEEVAVSARTPSSASLPIWKAG